MPRPMSTPRFARSGQCPACYRGFAADTAVLRTRSGQVLCEAHEDIVVPDSVTARGLWSHIRTIKETS